MKPFVVSPTIKFPANAATSTFAFLGTRGSGKTYGAGVFVEQLLDQDVQTVVVDPVGVWYGLRLAPDGKRAGFAIPVFGGIHGDVPLEPTSGELVAQLIVEHRMSCVLDVSDFTEGQQHRFVLDLSREVFRRKKRSPSPLHIVFEEGHEFFPQFVDASSAPMVGAMMFSNIQDFPLPRCAVIHRCGRHVSAPQMGASTRKPANRSGSMRFVQFIALAIS